MNSRGLDFEILSSLESKFQDLSLRCSEGRGNSQGAGFSLGILSELIKAMNASDTAWMHAAPESAVILAIPDP